MSRPVTLEQSLLSNAHNLLLEFSDLYEQRLLVLEACASRFGGFDIDEYWKQFKIDVDNGKAVKDAARRLSVELIKTNIPVSLAISSLAREPISISEKKRHGAFYTDFRLAQFVADDCRNYLTRDSKIADIAAGSGILLAAVATQYFDRFPENYDQWILEHIYAFDLSENALRGARIAIAAHSSSVKAIKKMCGNWAVCDSLLFEGFPEHGFDIVVGNPPWGRVKLSLHSFINRTDCNYHVYGTQYGDFDKEQFLTKKSDALAYSKILKEQYSLLDFSEPDMYMAFLQRAISVLKPGGHLSYIVPAGLIRSLGTRLLRRFLIGCSEDLKYYLLDNKANFFEIDTRFKFLVVSQTKTYPNMAGCTEFKFAICAGDELGIHSAEEIQFSVEELERIRPDLTVPECRDRAEKDLFVKIYENGCFWKNEWQANIARELDMTNDRSKFREKRSGRDIPVIEGRMVQQFRFGAKAYISGSGRSAKWIPSVGTVKPQYYISRKALSEQLRWRVDRIRAGYCDIAGQTNERGMMTAVIPAGVVCGNKVPTIIFPGADGEKRLYFFIGVTNSFVFDWLLRRVLSTTVNYFLLFSLPMPRIDLSCERAKRIISIAKQLSCMGIEYYTEDVMGKLRAELDVEVAKAYGLDFNDLELIMKDFPLLDRQQPTIKGESRSTYSRDVLLSVAEESFQRVERYYTKRADIGRQKHAKAYIPTEMIGLSKRRYKMTQTINGLDIKLVIYKRIVEGDLSKFTATSNITQSGGGARDLRFSPAEAFFPVFQRMFTQGADGILRGQFSWANGAPTEAEIHPPTNSRPNEVRIGRIHESFPQAVIPNDSTDCVLLIVLDNAGRVSPYFTSLHSLINDNWHPAIKVPIIEGLTAKRSVHTTAMGYVDIENRRNYTNGRT